MPENKFYLYIQGRKIPLNHRTQLTQNHIPQLQLQNYDGVVAEVNTNPQNPSILGLQNCSNQIWIATLPNGETRRIEANRTIKLEESTQINFGSVSAIVSTQAEISNISSNRFLIARNIFLGSVIFVIYLFLVMWLRPKHTDNNSQISREAAVEVVEEWLAYKKVLYAQPYDTSRLSKILTGNYYHTANGAVKWLKKYQAQKSYGVQKIDSIDDFKSSGDRASIFITITEEVTHYEPGKSIDEGGTRKQRYDLQYEDGEINIRDAETLNKNN
jgi:hypothetical protein